MHIGIDFDNTIVCYDRLFPALAVEQGLISSDQALSKEALRKHFIFQGQEEVWTRLQGVGYGPQMHRAELYPGVLAFIKSVLSQNHAVSVVSHKTRYPYLGEAYDLHFFAHRWLGENIIQHLTIEERSHFNYYFEASIESKVARIRTVGCTHFVDDLEKILLHGDFPDSVRKILFTQKKRDQTDPDITQMHSWQEAFGLLGGAR